MSYSGNKNFWSDLKSFVTEYTFEVFILFVLFAVIFAIGIYIF